MTSGTACTDFVSGRSSKSDLMCIGHDGTVCQTLSPDSQARLRRRGALEIQVRDQEPLVRHAQEDESLGHKGNRAQVYGCEVNSTAT